MFLKKNRRQKQMSEEITEIEEKKEEDVADDIEELETEEKTSKKKEAEGIVNIYTSFNNTIAHVTDMAGQTLIKVTGGMITKHDRLKANPTIAMFIAKRLAEDLKEKGVKSLYVRIRAKTGNPAPGPGANAIIKSLSREGFKILNILETTRTARGGPKKKGGRRGRRV
jgi:small subunit ribosomal protein S11